MTGANSIGLFRLLIDRLEELLPNTERIEIPGASHMVHEDNAQAFNSALFAFTLEYRQTA